MIVRLTDKQYKTFGNYVPDDIAHLFTHDSWRTNDTTVDVRAPYVAWEIALEGISHRLFVQGLGRNPGDRKRMKSLLMRISKPMNVILMHPALRGQAMVGSLMDIFCGWPIEQDQFGRRWLPSIRNVTTALPDAHFQMLTPQWGFINGAEYTEWTWANPVIAPPLWIYDPPLNEALNQRTALPALRPASPSDVRG
jgi:hypothetical protein